MTVPLSHVTVVTGIFKENKLNPKHPADSAVFGIQNLTLLMSERCSIRAQRALQRTHTAPEQLPASTCKPILHSILQLLQTSLHINLRGKDNLFGENEQVAKKTLKCNLLLSKFNEQIAWMTFVLLFFRINKEKNRTSTVCHPCREKVRQQSHDTHLSHFQCSSGNRRCWAISKA